MSDIAGSNLPDLKKRIHEMIELAFDETNANVIERDDDNIRMETIFSYEHLTNLDVNRVKYSDLSYIMHDIRELNMNIKQIINGIKELNTAMTDATFEALQSAENRKEIELKIPKSIEKELKAWFKQRQLAKKELR